MATLTISDIPEDLFRVLETSAAEHGHSVETEVLRILEVSLLSEKRIKLGSLLAETGQDARLTDDEFAIFDKVRDKASDKRTRPSADEHLVRARQIRDTLKGQAFSAADIAAAIEQGRL